MKKRIFGALVCMLVVLCLGACSNKQKDKEASSEEIVVPDEPVLPDAATVVEKVINNEDVIEIGSNDSLDSDTVDEAEVEQTEVTIFYVSGDYSEFKQSVETLNKDYEPNELLNKLSVHNIVPVDAKVVDFTNSTSEDGKAYLSLSLNDSFRSYLDTMSKDAEQAILACVADTFLYNYDADQIIITINGDVIKTNTGEYGDAFEWTESPLNLKE